MRECWIDEDIELSGRDAELRRCVQLLERAPQVTGTLEVVGEPGIGKSTIVDHTIREAAGRGFRVMSARPSRAEAALAYAVLGDLFLDIEAPADLTPPEQRALDIALGRIVGDGVAISTRTLGAAVAATLRSLARSEPVLVTIDDLQWVDAATAEVLAYVLRRLPASNTVVLLARRPTGEMALSPDDQLELSPLSDDAMRHVADRLATTVLSRSTIERIIDTASGNPLYLIELARTVAAAPTPTIVPLPVPASLHQVVAERITALPDATILALAQIALLANPTIDVLTTLGVVGDLPAAERASIIDVVGRSVRFRHPLLASAAHDAVTGTQRLLLHRRLAAVTTGLERCIHLAFGADQPDRATAAELAGALPDLILREATAEAADLAQLALSITPADDPARAERLLVCGDTAFRAGRTRQALEHLELARAEAQTIGVRARALLGLAVIEYSHTDNAERAAQLAAEAIELSDDPALLADAHTILSRVLYTDFRAAAEHAAAALQLMEQVGLEDDLALAMALNASATASFLTGHGLDRAMFDRAIELERGSAVSAADSALGALGAHLKYADAVDEARAVLLGLVDESDEASLPYALSHLPQIELWTGRWQMAEAHARRHLELAQSTNQESQVQGALFNLAVVAAFRGDVAEAEPLARALYDEGRSTGSTWTERNGAGLLGFIAMSHGDAAAAVEFLGRYNEIGQGMGLAEPGYYRFHADFVESLVATGDIERAEAQLDWIESLAVPLGRVSALATLHRGRALVAAHRNDLDRAVAEAHAATDILTDSPLIYDRARALLTLGVVLRRFKLRAEARAALTPALEMFEALGARSFVERAKVELSRLGVRSSSSGDLTETESRVAQLAAEGRTTRQIADTLFISAKTVEANMTRIYRKLGVTNRVELANLLTG